MALMTQLVLNQRESVASDNLILQLPEILKKAGFDLSKNIERKDDFFQNRIIFTQDD